VLLCPSMEKTDKILIVHNQINVGNLLSGVFVDDDVVCAKTKNARGLCL